MGVTKRLSILSIAMFLTACNSTSNAKNEPSEQQLSVLKSMGYKCKREKSVHSRIAKKRCTTSLQREKDQTSANKLLREYKAGGSSENQ
ncbi:hypothetical protein JQC92_04325 [Shewanella sp. 202IG2-18]|uniref:hypothetical protein n=1 Tax=Parashewanella hymeniacidonis TaxID=2807618 RepID=UPI001961D33B|nr:hypothetical protein [Parashewanella hymeniacidonis]MBM7071267.1 hypothetical protein [Parashewanella hymeniacidonis]